MKNIEFYGAFGKYIETWKDQTICPRVGDQVEFFKVGQGQFKMTVNAVTHKAGIVVINVGP